jgi:hypothetical protein
MTDDPSDPEEAHAMTDTAALPQVYPDHEPLCVDVPIGHLMPALDGGPRSRVPIHLSLDVEFYRRNTSQWGGTLDAAAHKYRLRGSFLELFTQVRVRYGLRSRAPSRWVPGFGVFGAADGPWPLTRFRPASGVDLADLLRMSELSEMYDRNLKTPLDGPATAVLIPREHERELRDIAPRLAG